MHALGRHSFIIGRPIFSLLFLIMAVVAGVPVSLVHASPAAVETHSTEATFSTYRWNLHDDALPLISLPDHLGGNLDLSLTYSLERFQLPLFQTLYFNERAGNYILMVLTSETRQAEFVVLDSIGGSDQFHARGSSTLKLEDKGEVKVLSASDGVKYTFARFADGELHCSRIHDGKGIVISLKYSDDAYINSIADAAGRQINFNYTTQYLSSVTQIWGDESRQKQTWAISDRKSFARRPASAALFTRMEPAKVVPTNAVKPGYTEEMAESDVLLAGVFGGRGAIAAANSFEPRGLAQRYPLYRGDQVADDGRLLRGHLSYAMHIYGSNDGTGETELYVPAGFTSHGDTPTPTDAAISFYYPRLGQLTDVTLVVFHIADFQLRDEGGRVRIGSIGGPGGSNAQYKHSHLEFYKGDTALPTPAARVRLRIDPASVFAPQTVIASESSAKHFTAQIDKRSKTKGDHPDVLDRCF